MQALIHGQTSTILHASICTPIISSAKSQKDAINYIQRCSVENQKGTIAVHGDSALLVLNGTSLNIDSTL